MTTEDVDVLIVGGGISGMSAALFTQRADLKTEIINTGTSILNRNAHLENYPGFPRGINPRMLIDMMRYQIDHEGVNRTQTSVLDLEQSERFSVKLPGERRQAKRIILASWSNLDYLSDLPVETFQEGDKTFVRTDDDGETSVEGLYGTGRIARAHHQTIVTAGDGARVGLNVIEDLKPEFYHDWVAPEGYFTSRGRDVPEGCEEISEEERKDRAQIARERLREFLDSPPEEPPTPHPSQEEPS